MSDISFNPNDWDAMTASDGRMFFYRTGIDWHVTCDQCGQLFKYTRPNRRYCSAACKQKAYRERRAAGSPPMMRVIAFMDADRKTRRRVQPMECIFCHDDMWYLEEAHAHACDGCGAVFTRRHGWSRD